MSENTPTPAEPTEPEVPTPPAGPVVLSDTAGNLVASAGAAFMITGAVAVFIADSEAGAAALLALGLVLFLIGVARQLPASLKYKDTEVQMSAARDFVRETLDSATPEELPEVVERVEKLARKAPEIAAPAVSWHVTEQAMIESLRRAIQIALPDVEVIDGRSVESKFDLVVRSAATDRRVGIEVTNGRNTSGPRFGAIVERFNNERQAGTVDALTIISNGRSRANAWQAFQGISDVSFVVLSEDDETQSMLFAVRSLQDFLARRS